MKKPTYEEILAKFEAGEIRGFYDEAGDRYRLFVNSSGGISYYKGRSSRLGYAFSKEHTKKFKKYIISRKKAKN